jgi:transcriptional regulator with PAS, ATPase and Fis domain
MRSPEQATLIGSSHPMLELRQEIERIARSDAKVLITGESGVGKELVARAIHTNSPRAERAFIAVNCAGLPETLLESELFGHVKGSFTGAYRDKPGKLETADEGTIFLDEVGEMTLRMQGLLLRFLETGELQKVGSERASRRVDVRVVAATNRNLQDLIAQGQFREDLYYRLNVIHFWVPPLRERKEDIPGLIQYFLSRFSSNGYLVKGIDTEAFQALCDYAWPGNVRELQNVIERLIVTGRHEQVRPEDLPPEIRMKSANVARPSSTTSTSGCATIANRSGPRSTRSTWPARSPGRTSAT